MISSRRDIVQWGGDVSRWLTVKSYYSFLAINSDEVDFHSQFVWNKLVP